MADEAGLIMWLQGLQGGAATAVGALTGSVVGFGALVAGALFNAKLNRQRDDRLLRVETRGVAAAIRAELASVETTLRENAEGLRRNAPQDFVIPDIAHSVRMFPSLVDKIGLLGDPSLITEIVGAYIVIDQYCENLVMAGGQLGGNIPDHRRVVGMPAARTDFVAQMNENIADRLRSAMGLLDRFID
jgi:hypothetical protein